MKIKTFLVTYVKHIGFDENDESLYTVKEYSLEVHAIDAYNACAVAAKVIDNTIQILDVKLLFPI
jgi:hypothetical protein